MARITDGVNGGFSGKLGNVVFYTMNGGKYVRSLPDQKRKKTPPTPKQAVQRARFTAIQEWLKPIIPLVREGFRHYASRQSGHNAAMSYNLKNSVELIGKYYEVNPETFAFSQGPLPEPYRPRVVQEGDTVRFYWEDIGDSRLADPSDRTMLLLYRGGGSQFNLYGNMRGDLQDSLSIVGAKAGDRYHAYIAFISIKDQQVSNSMYLGMLEVEAIRY